MDKNSIKEGLNHLGLVAVQPDYMHEDPLRGASNFTGISGKTMIEEMSRTHPNIVDIGGSEGYTGAETSGGGADPNEAEEGSGTGSGIGGDAGQAGGGTGYDLGGETGREESSGRGNQDTTVNPGGLGSDDDS